MNFIRLDPQDNVVTVTKPIELGVAVDGVTANQMIPRGHKVATSEILSGDVIRKYAQIIGYASQDIRRLQLE